MDFEVYITIKDLGIIPDNKGEYLGFLEKNHGKKGLLTFTRETGIRTPKQNNSLHLGCSLLADVLNNGGLDMRKVLKPEIMIPWTTESVKKELFKPIMKLMFDIESTKELDKKGQISEVWETLLRHLMQVHHIDYVQFPSKVTKIEEKGQLLAYPKGSNEITSF